MSAVAKKLPPPPPLLGLRTQYATNPRRLKEVSVEIYDTWMNVSGPAERPADGYEMEIFNRMTLSADEAQVLQNDGLSFMLFSMFSGRFIEFASVHSSVSGTQEIGNIAIWAPYATPWTDTWPGMQKTYPEGATKPTGYQCVRSAAGIDAFTAYFLGLVENEVPARPGSYRAVFDEKTGIITGVRYTVATETQTDEQYDAMQTEMMNVIANAVTARESAREYATAKRAEILRESPAVFADMLASDMARMNVGENAVDPALITRTRDLIRTAMTTERPKESDEMQIEEIE